MEPQKQSVLATKEQLRLAEITQTGNDITTAHDDIALQKRVKKVIELTRCTQSEAEVALIDSEGNVGDAVALLLDNPENLILWSQKSKNRKSKATSVISDSSKSGAGSLGRRNDSQRGRNRQEGNEQQSTMSKYSNNTFMQPRSARTSQARDQNGFSGIPRTRSERATGFKGQGRDRGGYSGGYRRDRGTKDREASQRNKPDGTDNGNVGRSEEYRGGWTNGGGAGGEWGDTTGWGDEKKSDATEATSNDEWKSGPRVFMPSSTVTTEAKTEANYVSSPSSNWPALDNFTPSSAESAEPVQQKPKTFAAVAAAKKTTPVVMHQPQKQEQPMSSMAESVPAATTVVSLQKEQSIPHSALEAKPSDEPVVEWSSSIEWGNSLSPHPSADHPEFAKQLPESSSSNVYTASTHSLSVNQEYTDQLKNAIGLVQSNQHVAFAHPSGSASSCTTAVDYMQQHHIQHLQTATNSELDQPTEKVEFVTGDALPPPTSTSYQFGFNFNSAKEGNTWGPQPQHISSVELDRAVLKNSTSIMLSTMTSIPTTSSSVSAHFNAASQQAQAIESQQRISNGSLRSGAGGSSLSFTDAASVNFPPSNGPPASSHGGTLQSGHVAQQPSAPPQQLQQNKPLYTHTSAPLAPPHMQQHLQQQQPQAMFHQTSAAPPVHQFANYNMPYVYSPVAAAPTLQGPSSELDRYLIPQYAAAPYSQLDLQMGAMSMGPPTTLAPNRATLEYMENKFGQHQQQNVSQGGNTGPYQQTQPNQQQQQRNIGQSETATLLGGPPSHVGPPPGFGMPTAPTQPSYAPQLQSLFQMPTYHHPNPYQQQHHYMMSNASRLQNAQRPAQASPPEGNGPPQRRGNDPQGYSGAGPDAGGDQHSSGGGSVSQYGGNNFKSYRSYM